MGRALPRTLLQARAEIIELKKKATWATRKGGKSNQEANRIAYSMDLLTNRQKEQKYSSLEKILRANSKAVKIIS